MSFASSHELYFFAYILEGGQILLSERGSFLPCLRKINVKWCIIFADKGSCMGGWISSERDESSHNGSMAKEDENGTYSSLVVYLPPSISRTASVASRLPLCDEYIGHRLLAASLSTH